ncbi:glycine/betaine ABC transporter substrate-binding protein [Burkholderia pseudomallei MSHR338]|nr:glycine betaine/L-proline ABC transporter, periplasmic glycine betaine/L-proline-binding protein [Burkholderia pseudomallei 668]EBA46174.1 glycine betaine/L-proline ABC transporter, periplasmic glycine betaine/L-proline-binding protein [Burkholderia pseudomallei 305]EDU11402.1 glycine betaine/L-proline ABC transporter, periplasmic glycine betaine/L-proline-binding protein [Burkholderia pseudomallei 1655]EEP50396.1 glycine betaine/L-proline ABC transporter, periplasmic glycine betaine/L-prolin
MLTTSLLMRRSTMKRNLIAAACGLAIAAAPFASARAGDAPTCKAVRFADVGWTDIAATTGLASTMLAGLGYAPTKTIASVPITFAGIKSKQIDVFLGYWSPTMDPMIAPFTKAGTIKVLAAPNLTGAKYTLAVPDYVYQGGLKSFADIQKYADKLNGRIYGIEPGNDGNALIKKMIDGNQFGLGKFKLVESSEAGMLVEVNRAIRDKQWIVFLGWEPHPMNVQMKIDYLSGGDDVFGPNYGEAKVLTATPPDYAARCPNVAKFVSNLQFTTSIENHVMLPIMNKEDPNKAAAEWLKANPQSLDKWLAGVTTFDGKPGLPAVKHYLGIQ